MARARRTRAATRTEIDNLRHDDKRVNIPTEELREFVAPDEAEPKTLLYPRDPSLDPQLVWKGKDEQDRADLAVQAVPIYIQEKIQPRAIIEDLRRNGSAPQPAQLDLFGDFDAGLTDDEQVSFYQHEENWSNRLILGDSLLVMASLAEKEGLKGQVQMIYLDPPYGIKFGSNWQVSTRKRDVTDGRASDLTRQPEQIKAFRDTWQLGIHSYLTYLRDRLVVARELLTESGSIFVQIGDENVHLVRNLLDEVFGAENAVVTIVVKKKGSQKSGYLDPVNDYLLWYSKSGRESGRIKFRALWESRSLDQETLNEFRWADIGGGTVAPVSSVPSEDGEAVDFRLRPAALFQIYGEARLFRPWPITNGGERSNQMDPIELQGKTFRPPSGRCWTHTSRSNSDALPGMHRVRAAGRLIASGKALDYLRYLDDAPTKMLSNWWDGLGGASDQVYVVQTNTEIVKRCILMTTDPGDLVLDPTCGSGTTAYVAERWGRRWITIDTSRVALALARTRLMASQFPYYLLANSAEGRAREQELTGAAANYAAPPSGDIKQGFVYKRIPRITSSTIANNEEIDVIHAHWQERMEPLRAQLNQLLGMSWEEWEIPRDLDASPPHMHILPPTCSRSGGMRGASGSGRSTHRLRGARIRRRSTISPMRTTSGCASPVPSP